MIIIKITPKNKISVYFAFAYFLTEKYCALNSWTLIFAYSQGSLIQDSLLNDLFPSIILVSTLEGELLRASWHRSLGFISTLFSRRCTKPTGRVRVAIASRWTHPQPEHQERIFTWPYASRLSLNVLRLIFCIPYFVLIFTMIYIVPRFFICLQRLTVVGRSSSNVYASPKRKFFLLNHSLRVYGKCTDARSM